MPATEREWRRSEHQNVPTILRGDPLSEVILVSEQSKSLMSVAFSNSGGMYFECLGSLTFFTH